MPKRENWLKRTDRGMFARPEVLYQGPNNPRTDFNKKELAILEEEIRQDGVLQPLMVRRRSNDEGGELEIFDGERRFRCVTALRDKGSEVEWVPVVIERGSEAELMIKAAMTDTGKVKLDFVDQVNLVRMLTGYGLEIDTIAERLGMSTTWVRQRQDLVGMEPPTQKALRNKEITLGKALKMAGKTFAEQKAELKKVRERKANGVKKAGSVTPRPGKRVCREMAVAIEQRSQLYTSEQVCAVLRWASGEVSEEQLIAALGTVPASGKAAAVEQPVVH
jgi:ParB/RepB/Spo0J family partition protein